MLICPRFHFARSLPALFLALFLAPVPLLAQSQNSDRDLSSLNIEDLMKVEVSTVSKREQSLSETAAAIFVVSQEDIRRSGATNIPDLLRMVPGVYVAQINANSWAVCARAFNSRYSNELLVLVDGRTVYNPSFGGVFWEELDLPLEDIERIEVIRGPGGSVWGANAVNGVINIITKKAADTKGTLLVAGGGNPNQALAVVQHGASVGKSLDYRAFFKFKDEGSWPGLAGQPGADSWHELHGGFRADSRLSTKDTLSVQGDIYSGRDHLPSIVLPSLTAPSVVPFNSQVNVSGGFIQSSWIHAFSSTSSTTLLASYQRHERSDIISDARRTFDLDFQHNLSLGGRQQLVWGAAYRYTKSDDIGTTLITFLPSHHDSNLFSGFLQYQLDLAANRLKITLGTKLEHNSFSGFGLMPTARLAWVPNDKRSYWMAVSRALRTPADSDVYLRLNEGALPGQLGTPVVISIFGVPHPKNEEVIAYEAGYRTLLYKNLSMDFAFFYNDFRNQNTIEPAAPFFEPTPLPAHLVQPFIVQNLKFGNAAGLELYANWKLSNRWTISPGYSFSRVHLHLKPPSTDFAGLTAAGEDTPVQSAQLRSHVSLPLHLAWDTSIYFTGNLQSPTVPSYTRLDTGLTWQWKENLEISAFGQNLVQQSHLEFTDVSGSARSTLVPRGAYAKITWHF